MRFRDWAVKNKITMKNPSYYLFKNCWNASAWSTIQNLGPTQKENIDWLVRHSMVGDYTIGKNNSVVSLKE